MGRLRILGAMAAVAAGMPALAQSPALAAPSAIVEDAAPSVTSPEVLEYLDQGRVVQLKAGDWIVLGYLNSCIREEIHGGSVTVGATQSTVSGGKVQRSAVTCATSAQLSQAQAGKSGAMVFRKPPKPSAETLPNPSITVASVSPVLRPTAGGAIQLQRLDRPEPAITLPESRHAADLGKLGLQLAPGGLYRASAGGTSVVFRVDAAATRDAPLLSRLVRF